MDLRSQLQSTLGDAYTIERELSGGGMSRVFVATERALGREVVIKVLPSEMAGAVSIDRFKQEIALAARLQQANIVPVLSAGDMGGLPYFIMPYVAGESLRVRLAGGGELPIADAVGILREVARALSYAHGQGVVHRDIKPDNVLLSGGTAMVTDFGVAKALSAATADGGSGITATGVTVGTPAYMSPEQASADPGADHRADIYAFGCLAYELLTGQAPFAGRPAHAMLAAHATENPDPVGRRRPAIPGQLATLVMRCLEKRAADRPQSAAELVHALAGVGSDPGAIALPAPRARTMRYVGIAVAVSAAAFTVMALLRDRPVEIPSLAVLPMENPSGDTAYAYIAEGLTDELRSQLTEVPGLTMMARSSSVALKEKHTELSVIGTRYKIGSVLQGTVSPAGDRMRITLELVRTVSGSAMWSGTYTLSSKELLAVRDSIARLIIGALKLTGTGVAPRPHRAENPEARDLYLRGHFLGVKSNERDLRQSLVYFASALEKDPSMAEAHTGIAWAWAFLADAYVSPAEAYPKTKAAALKAIALDSTLAEAHAALAMALGFHDWDFRGAERALLHAIALRPKLAEARSTYGLFLNGMGRANEAIAQLDSAIAVDPLSMFAGWQRSWVLHSQHRYRDAIAQHRRIVELEPRFFYLEWIEGAAYRELGLLDSAFASFAKAKALAGAQPMAELAITYAKTGRRQEAMVIVRGLEEWYQHHYYPPDYIAAAWASLGDLDRAFAWLARTFEVRSSLWLLWGGASEFEVMRTDPRWAVLERRARGP